MPSASTSLRPALIALVLLVAVAMTACALFLWWPIGVAVGVAVGGGAVLAVGASMQRTESRVPEDDELAGRLGIAVPEPAAVLVGVPAGPDVPAVPALDVQQDVAWFSTEPDPAPVVAEPEPVAIAPEPVETVQEPVVAEAVPAARETEPVAEAVPAAEPVVPAAQEPAPVAGTEPEEPSVAPEEPAAVAAEPVEDDGPEVIPSTHFELADDDSVRTDLERLKAELGDDYRDFARAVRLVVSTQYASAARLQRDLDVPYSRARRLITDLEEQHFIGPKTGSLPRVVLLPKERLPEVERLLAEV